MKQKYLEEEDFALLKVSQKEQFPKKKRHISLIRMEASGTYSQAILAINQQVREYV